MSVRLLGFVLPMLLSFSLVARTFAQPPSEGAEKPSSDAAPSAAAEPESTLPRLEEVPLPEMEELLSETRRDWVVLQDGRVLIVEPVFPRPGTLAKIDAQRDAILADPKRRFSPEGRERLNELTKLIIFLPGKEASTEYQLSLTDIKEIIHHEDLMLRRADQLIEAGDTRKAFELMFVVARRDPQWPGLTERQVRLTAADASRQLDEGNGERALTYIESLYERKPIPDEADDLLDRAADLLVGKAIEAGDFRRARFELQRVQGLDQRHRALDRWTNTLSTLARSLQSEAEQAAASGDLALAVETIERAARVWPNLNGLRPIHTRLTARYQRLLVGVPAVAPQQALAIPSDADDRVRRLTEGALFEIDGFEGSPSYRSVYFERWEPTDLGRRARFELRPTLPSWSARPPLTSSEVVSLLSHRMTPGSAAFDSRFADLTQTLRVLGPYEFEVVFQRAPLRVESVLARTPRVIADDVATTEDPFQRFNEASRDGSTVIYRRTRPEPEATEPHLAEVLEIAFPSYEKAIQAFDRGEVRMLADVPAWDVPRLLEDKRYVVTKSGVPTTHLLQFHAESEPLKSTELRRAIALSADAAKLLSIIVGTGGPESGRLVTAPYPSTHLGYDPLVAPRRPDLALALALRLAAEKRFGGTLPELIFAAPGEAPLRQVAETLAAAWKRIGIPVRLVTLEELGPDGRWDLAYRSISMADPATSLAPLITMDPGVSMASLADLPDWLRQRLIDLERAGDATTAQAVLIDLHRQLHADVRCVPLFEVDRFDVSRGAIRGRPDIPVAFYENVERWVLPPDYPEATP